MAVVNPIGYLQNAGTVHTAEVIRADASLMSVGRHTAGGLRPLGGVHRDMGSGYSVVQNGTPNMSVNVNTGVALVPGTEGGTQGSYVVVNSATENLSIAAAHASLARIDRVGIRVRDSAYSGANDDGANVVITGTPAGSPAAPSAPNNFLTLALVSIPANDTAITDSQITDMRIGLAAPGGVIMCTSANRPVSGQISIGQELYETDTTMYRKWDGSTWVQSRPWRLLQRVTSATHPVTISPIPSTLRSLRINFAARCTQAAAAENMHMRINNLAAGQYLYTRTYGQNAATTTATNDQTTNIFPVAVIPGASTTSTFFGTGVINLEMWHSPTNFRAGVDWVSGAYCETAPNSFSEKGHGTFNSNGPFTRIDFRTSLGSNFVAETYFQLEGWE